MKSKAESQVNQQSRGRTQFLGRQKRVFGTTKDLNLELDARGNVLANDSAYKTNKDKFFVAGDSRRGQSLVVWAIREGRQCAESICKYLMDNK